jgi:outer membrane autotransporter protein
LLTILVSLGSIFLSLPVGAAIEIQPPSVGRTVGLGDQVNVPFTITTGNDEVLTGYVLTEEGLQDGIELEDEPSQTTALYTADISQPQEHCTSVFPTDGLVANGRIVGCEFNCSTSASASVDLTFIDPLTISTTSENLQGAPGEIVRFTATFSGGRPDYDANSTLGAAVTIRNGSLEYEYAIPSDATGNISDEVRLTGQATDCEGNSATIDVSISVLPALSAAPSSLEIEGAPGQQVTGTVNLSGGKTPYQASAQLGTASVNGSSLTYQYTIPNGASGRINDTITVTDEVGAQLSVPVTITVSGALSAAPSLLEIQGAPGELVTGAVTVAGGKTPYQASAQLGTASVNGSSLTYQYTIPNRASGTINDTIAVTDSVSGTAAVEVVIIVIAPPVVVNPSPIELTALSLVNVTTSEEQKFSVSGGTPPYALTIASGGRGTVEPARLAAPGNATYRVDIPANAKTASTISDRILVTDAKGITVEVPAIVRVAASDTLSSRPDLTPNERSVARAIETVCPQLGTMGETRNAAQQDLFEQCSDMLSNPGSSGIPNTLNQVTDEKARASTSAGIEVGNQQLSNVGSRLADLRGGSAGVDLQGLSFNIAGQSVSAGKVAGLVASQVTGGAASADSANSFFDRWGFFLKGTFNFGDKNTTENEAGFDFDTKGVTGGADYRFSEKLVAGGAIGFSRNNVDYASSGGGLDTDTWHLAAYGSYYASERTYIDAIVEYGWQDHDSERGIQYRVASNLDPVRRTAKASYDGNQLGASLGAGYDLDQGPLSYGVYGRVGYIKVDIDGFQEKGAAGLNLKLDDFDATSVTTTLGGRISRVFNTNKAVIVPQLRFEWEHEYDNDATNLVARFAADPINTSFGIASDSPDRDYFRLGLGVSAVFPHGVSAFVNYDTLLDKRDWTDHLIDLGVRWEF